MAKEPNWSPEELKVVDRFVSDLRDLRFLSMRAAATECWKQLKGLQPHGRHGESFAGRTWLAVYSALGNRARAAGVTANDARWRPAELRLLDRYLALVVARRYPSVRKAAEACRQELRRRGLGERTFGTVRCRMILRARQGSFRWPGVHWSDGEKRVLRRHARALLRNGDRSARSIVLACQRDLRRLPLLDRDGILQRPSGGRGFASVYEHVITTAHSLGWSRQSYGWASWESRALRRYSRALIEGRFSDAPTAASACRQELVRLARDRSNGELRPPRTVGAIVLKMKDLVARTRLARNRSRLSRGELRIVERYARAVDRGEYDNWKDAARACVTELNRKVNAAAVRSPLRVRKAKGHSMHTIHTRILDVAHRLKLRGPRRVLWTDAEERVCAAWMRWSDRHRTALRHRGVWSETLAGMQEELENAGYRRSLAACESKVRDMRMRAYGVA
jgi:hypothetical protein